MSVASHPPRLPSPTEAVIHGLKVRVLRARRSLREAGKRPPLFASAGLEAFPHVLAESRTPLWTETDPAEQRLQMGKVHNLRLVLRGFRSLVVPAGQVLSFWRQAGRPVRRRGFVAGRQIQGGCVVPAVAGGICQLSNALYDAALRAGLEVVERHGHTRMVPNSPVASGRDATVSWNYVDLRLRGSATFGVSCWMTDKELVVQVLGQEPKRAKTVPLTTGGYQRGAVAVGSTCATCGEDECFRHRTFDHSVGVARTAFLVDQVWPEHQTYLGASASGKDLICQPIDGGRFRLERYAWKFEGERLSATVPTLRRSWSSRRLAQQGAARRRAELKFAEELALAYARRLPFDATHLVVHQGLLPFLWANGALQGRTFDVLMQRLPMAELQKILDAEFLRQPDRKLLADFRAPGDVVRNEAQALKAARKIITPHTQIASLFPDQAELTEWLMPESSSVSGGRKIAFPGPTISRKGAHEVREAVRRLGVECVVMGSQLEGADFWNGLPVSQPTGDWLEGVGVVVQPAVLEEQPRRLLRALACGVPVIATEACGLGDREGVTLVPVGAADALCLAIERVLGGCW